MYIAFGFGLPRWIRWRGQEPGAKKLTFKSYLQSVASSGPKVLEAIRHPRAQRTVHLGGPSLFRVPPDLSVESSGPHKVLVLGECVAVWIGGGSESIDCSHDFILINNYSVLPDTPPSALVSYDFQLIQIPLRSVLPEWEYLEIPFSDENGWQLLLDNSCSRLTQAFDGAMRYNTEHGLLTFVAGFLIPQQNPMGRLLPRDDPRNLVFVVESLNRHLVALVSSSENAHFFDMDQIASGIGKQFIQDDVVNAVSHGSFLNTFDFDRDQERIEPTKSIDNYFDIRTDLFRESIWTELRAMFRTLQQTDQVKLVVVDLDDTLWRGVVAEGGRSDETIEGWPMGIIEALQFLKKRGILLGIVSKNDEATIEALWEGIFGGRLRLDDFVVRKINWRPKADNLEEVLEELNLLSRSVVFVDDNPVERAGIAAAFPEVRVLGSELYHLKRVLSWAPETQVAFVSEESGRRSKMVQGQLARERERRRIPREEFLEGLGIEIRLATVLQVDRASSTRAIELLNKTNQFNTTARRWTVEDLNEFRGIGGSIIGFEVQDRFTDYGMVGVVVLRRTPDEMEITQVVMSCRVFGLDVEVAAMTEVINRMWGSTSGRLTGVIQRRSENQPCWDLFLRLGFGESDDGVWIDNGGFIPNRPFCASVKWKAGRQDPIETSST